MIEIDKMRERIDYAPTESILFESTLMLDNESILFESTLILEVSFLL